MLNARINSSHPLHEKETATIDAESSVGQCGHPLAQHAGLCSCYVNVCSSSLSLTLCEAVGVLGFCILCVLWC